MLEKRYLRLRPPSSKGKAIKRSILGEDKDENDNDKEEPTTVDSSTGLAIALPRGGLYKYGRASGSKREKGRRVSSRGSVRSTSVATTSL